MGDFNAQPYSVPIAILRSHAGLIDSYNQVYPQCNDHTSPHPSAREALERYGMTCDSILNTYSAGKPIPDNITEQGGKRLDYIFFRQPEIARRRPLIWGYRDDVAETNGWDQGQTLEEGKPMPQSVSSAPVLRCVKSEVVLTENVPGKPFSYSDHFALFSTFHIDSPAKEKSNGTGHGEDFTPLVPMLNDSESLNANTTTFAPVSPPRSPNPDAISVTSEKSQHIRSALNTLRLYTRISQHTAKLHLRYFAAAVVSLIALTVGSAWQPKSWLQPIFTLVGGLLGAAGATFLYTGFVWGKWELGLLTETTEEMELELRVVEMEDEARVE